MMDWLSMGGYASYVWLSYGLSFAALLGLGVVIWRGHARAKADLARLEGPSEQ